MSPLDDGVGSVMTKWVYSFGDGAADGSSTDRNLLGGKGANLAEMASLGLPVPPGFTITTDLCAAYYAGGESYPDDLGGQVEEALAQIEKIVGAKFGDPSQPLLVSVRSGARVSMPGVRPNSVQKTTTVSFQSPRRFKSFSNPATGWSTSADSLAWFRLRAQCESHFP